MTTIISGSSPSITFSDSTTQSTTAPSTSTFGFKNRIINGSFSIDQRNAGTSFTALDNTYGLDRWRTFIGAASKFSIQQQTSIVPPNTTYAAKITSLSSYTVGSTEAFTINQPIEGFNVNDLGWGTATAKTVTLSFQVYSSLTGTFSGSIFNSAWDRSYCFTYSIPTATTWTTISITIAGDTTGTWLTNNSTGLVVNFSLGCGSTFNGTANAWNAGRYACTAGSVSVVGTSGATWYATNVQLEVGTQATTFDFRDYGRELMLCQRYFAKIANDGTSGEHGIATGFQLGTTAGYFCVVYPVTMRTQPTATSSNAQVSDQVGFSANATISSNLGTLNNSGLTFNFSANGRQFGGCSLIASNNTSGYVAFSSEL